MVEEARRADVALELVPGMGDFVAGGAPLVRIHGDGGSRLDRKKIRQLVWLGGERSHADDPAYGFRKLVDIAERGLASPICCGCWSTVTFPTAATWTTAVSCV